MLGCDLLRLVVIDFSARSLGMARTEPQEVRIVTDLCEIFTKMNTTKSPWAPSLHAEEGTKFIQIRKDDRGIPRAIGMKSLDSTRKAGSWGGLIDAITIARDQSIETMIDKYYADRDRERPVVYVAAYCGANVPKVITVKIPEVALPEGVKIPEVVLRMRACSRKYIHPEIELSSTNVSWFLNAVRAWHDDPPPVIVSENDSQVNESYDDGGDEDDAVVDDDDDEKPSEEQWDADSIAPVKWRRKRNQDWLMIEWLDSKGQKHTQWELPKRESQIKEMVQVLKSAFFEEIANGATPVLQGDASVRDKPTKRQRTMLEMFGK